MPTLNINEANSEVVIGEDDYRENFFYMRNSLIKALEMIVDIVGPSRSSDHVLIISCRACALMVYGKSNYLKVLEVIPFYKGESTPYNKMQINLLAYHDSCWREGIKEFVGHLLEMRAAHPEDPSFLFTLNVGRWEALRDLNSDTQRALRTMDFNHTPDYFPGHSPEDLMHKTLPFDQKIFHLISKEM